MRSRPRRVLSTRPELCITRKCLLMAWRVTPVPAVSLLIEAAPCSQRRETSRRRIWSPNAANRGAESSSSKAVLRLGLFRKIFLDELDDHAPALLIRGEGLRAARQRDLIKARFRDGEHYAVGYFLEREADERGRLF